MNRDRRRRADGGLTPRAAGQVARFEIDDEIGDLDERVEIIPNAEASPSGRILQVGCEPTARADDRETGGVITTTDDAMPPELRAHIVAQLTAQAGGDPEGVVDQLV